MASSSSSFKVFGCGLPRTGTLSTSKALEQLLGGKCHHGFTIAFEKGCEHMDFWTNFSRSENRDLKELREFLLSRGYTAGIDVPITFHYKDMLEAFPDVKVLLTVRDPKAWYKSYLHVMGRFLSTRRQFIHAVIGKFIGKDDFHDLVEEKMADLVAAGEQGEDAAVAYFNKWIQQIKEDIPSDRLLVYDVREGWEPLCKFLNVPVPNCEFPHVNSSASVTEIAVQTSKPFMRALLIAAALMTAGLAYILYGLLNPSDPPNPPWVSALSASVLFILLLLFLFAAYKLDQAVGEYTLS